MNPLTSRRFWLIRGAQHHSDGVVFPDGIVVLRQRDCRGTSIYANLEEARRALPLDRILFVDEPTKE